MYKTIEESRQISIRQYNRDALYILKKIPDTKLTLTLDSEMIQQPEPNFQNEKFSLAQIDIPVRFNSNNGESCTDRRYTEQGNIKTNHREPSCVYDTKTICRFNTDLLMSKIPEVLIA